MPTEPILIIEDETLLAMDIEGILADGGYTVAAIAADRAEALAAAAKARIAFVDLNLRDGPTGPAIACELAETYGITIVYVTANPSQIAPRARNAVGVVAKPFRPAAILQAAAIAAGRAAAALGLDSTDITLFSPAAPGFSQAAPAR